MANNDKTIQSVQDLLSIIREIKNKNNSSKLLFRGQHEDKSLLPRLGRPPFNINIRETEKKLIDEFKRGLTPLSEFKPEDEWDNLALAQHHGLPTRLLDWTFNPLVALWFTVNKPLDNKDGVLWILKASEDDFKTEQDKDPFAIGKTKIFLPRIISRRISAQAGAFTVHRMIEEKNKFYKFETNNEFMDKLSKYNVPSSKFREIQSELNTLGINDSTLFPDLDGFCKYLTSKYTGL